MIKHYWNAMRKDGKLIALVIIFIILGIAATILANQCSFLECQPSAENPGIVSHPSY